jgi:SAM-dependent methyltransferase
MKSQTAFAQRAGRLARICDAGPLDQDFPLLKALTLDAALFGRLRDAVNNYLYVTLDAYYQDRKFDPGGDFLKTERGALAGLPNITPNGLVLPKRQTAAAYNLVHQTVAGIFTAFGLADHARAVHAPVNIRLVNGRPDAAIDGRPRASAKMHSDMWAGEPAGAIMVFLPVFGAAGNTGIKWIEPLSFPQALMGPLDDFDAGAHLAEGGREYDCGLTPGVLLLADPYLIHATQKNSNNLRLSIDFRFLPAETLASDDLAPGTRLDNYLAPEDWADIGTGRVLTSDAPLADYDGPDLATSNDYAAQFPIKFIDGEPRRITAGDLARLLDMEIAGEAAPAGEAVPSGLEYQNLDAAETAVIQKRARDILRDAKLTAAGPGTIGNWQRGWGEILERVREMGVSEATLAPQYFRHDVLRLDGRYIRAADTGFEPRLYAAMRAALFQQLFAGLSEVIEFGCGTGQNLYQLHRLLPGLRLTGADWAQPSQELIRLIGRAENAPMDGVRFDMASLEGAENLAIEPGAGIMTLHAMEQLGANFAPFLDYLIGLKPAIVLHLEPIAELYDASNPFDAAALAYHAKRGYLTGLLGALKSHAAAGRIEILKIHRSGFGSTFHEAYSIVVWRAG